MILKENINSCYYCFGQYVHRKIPRRYSWSWLSSFSFFYPYSYFLLWLILYKEYSYLPYQIVNIILLICIKNFLGTSLFHNNSNLNCFCYNGIWEIYVCLLSIKRVLLNRAPTSTKLHSPPPSSIQLHPALPSSTHLHLAHFSFHPALCNTLNNIWTKILHVIGQFPQI